jgi:kynurenine 3-monooxygenase
MIILFKHYKNNANSKKIAIVGSGLVGSLLAIYLRKAGHTVHLYDRSPDIRQIQFSGRSINLAMSNRGWKALDGVGISDSVHEIAPMDKRAIHLVDKLNFQNYGQEGESIYSISRGDKRMIDLAEQAGAEFFFEQKIWDVTLSEATLHIGETERELGKKRNMIVLVLMVFLEYATACNAKYV